VLLSAIAFWEWRRRGAVGPEPTPVAVEVVRTEVRPDRPLQVAPESKSFPLGDAKAGGGGALFEDALVRCAAKFSGYRLRHEDTVSFSLFGTWERRGLREGRILCAADPEGARILMRGWALGESYPLGQRQFALWMLNDLVMLGHSDALRDIFDAASQASTPKVVDLSVCFLYPFMQDADSKRLYRKHFADRKVGSPSSALLMVNDPENFAMFEPLREANNSTYRWYLQYREVLQSPDWDRKVLGYVAQFDDKIDPLLWGEWALDVGFVNRLSGLKAALRFRLDANWAAARRGREMAIAQGSLKTEASLEDQYVRGDGGSAIYDEIHDRALLYLWHLKGELTPLELRRLQYHGWTGDQTANLKAILGN
jgi:hypothetical protein